MAGSGRLLERRYRASNLGFQIRDLLTDYFRALFRRAHI